MKKFRHKNAEVSFFADETTRNQLLLSGKSKSAVLVHEHLRNSGAEP